MRLRTRLAAPAFSSLRLSPLPPTRPIRPPRGPLAVLFLGDKGHHRPADRYAQIAPVLAGRGIEVTYTEKMSDLNPETLGKYDALLIYANTTRISKDQEKALLDYVDGRRRLRPAALRLVLLPELARVHRAGRRPVPEARHRRVRDDGRRPRPSDHQGARAVPHLGRDLRPHQAQHEGPPRPPDPRRPGRLRALDLDPHARQGARLLHRLRPRRPHLGPSRLPRPVERGIRWAANKGDVFDSRPRVAKGLKPFEYEPAEIPLYTPGARWGTQGEPIRRMQKPLAPEESQQAPRPAGRVRGEAVRRRAADLQADHA